MENARWVICDGTFSSPVGNEIVLFVVDKSGGVTFQNLERLAGKKLLFLQRNSLLILGVSFQTVCES